MGLTDIAPLGAPQWLVPMSTAVLGAGVVFWDLTYILLTLRGLRDKSYGMPLAPLVINVSWEIVYALYVCEAVIEKIGFAIWLLLDIGVVYCTIIFAPREWASSSPWVGRNMAWILAVLVAIGCVGHFAFISWFLGTPGMGHGDKTGKWWRGHEGFDTSECAFWSAAVAQFVLSADSIAMLLIRRHSGGTSYLIW